jgi:hypothetical protein
MTKLLQWLLGLAIMVAVWAAVLNGQVFPNPKEEFYFLKLLWPVGLVGVFGIYSILVSFLRRLDCSWGLNLKYSTKFQVIAYRVYNFNDCAEAAAELVMKILTL